MTERATKHIEVVAVLNGNPAVEPELVHKPCGVVLHDCGGKTRFVCRTQDKGCGRIFKKQEIYPWPDP